MDLDDLYTLYLISQNNQTNLLGVTVSGTESYHYPNAANNAAGVLFLANKTNKPVSEKLTPAFCSGREPPNYFDLVEKRIQSYNLPRSPIPPIDETGVELIHKIALSKNEKFTVISVGPLTNIAHAITEHPSVKEKIERIIFLGGSLHTTESITVPLKKSWQFSSRYTLFIDPCAANIVLTSGIPITVIPLDVTNLIPLDTLIFEKYARPKSSPGSKFVLDVLKSNLKSDEVTVRTPFWNMVAFMCLSDRSIIRTTKLSLKIITEHGENFGQLVNSEDGNIAEVCTYINPEKFYQKFFKMVNNG